MHEIRYENLVQETLIQKWSSCKEPLNIHEDDFRVGVELLTGIALEAIHHQPASKTIEAQVSLNTEPLSEIADKIKAFVKDQARTFKKACKTGFPFSLLERSSAEAALKHTLENQGSILSHFINLQQPSVWMNEKELDQHFSVVLQRVRMSEIVEVILNLKMTYMRDKDNRSGYYLLWLIKKATGCNYEIPEKISFDLSTVASVLSHFFTNFGSLTNVIDFIEILCSWDSESLALLYREFLDRKAHSIFINFVAEYLQSIPMDRWQAKDDIIVKLLKNLLPQSKLYLAKVLSSSKDPSTAQIGNHLIAVLTASSFKDAIPHFHDLQALSPCFTHASVENISGLPFKKFCDGSSIFGDPEFAKRLIFNSSNVFVYDSLMIGVYNTNVRGKEKSPYLLAYDMSTEKMVWGIDLTSKLSGSSLPTGEDYRVCKIGKHISLQCKGEKQIHLIHPETGEFDGTLEFSEAPEDIHAHLPISPEGFTYYIVDTDQGAALIGGKFIAKQWNLSFTVKAPSPNVLPFSTHCGFQRDFVNELTLFGPAGHQVTIYNCMEAKAYNDKLYAIEKDPVHEDKCLLNIRSLKIDNKVVSSVEKSISLNVEKSSFGNFCQNGQLILFSRHFSANSPIFIDLNSQEITYSQYNFSVSTRHIINTASGELWTWDPVSKEIWKVSSIKIIPMGSMKSGESTVLVHVDKEDRLYFVNVPC